MEWIIGVVSGVIAGIISSLVIFFCVYNVKPQIKISDYIAKKNENGCSSYYIKVVNCSRFQCIAVSYELTMHTPYGMHNCKVDDISSTKRPITMLYGFLKNDKNTRTEYAIQIGYDLSKYECLLDNSTENQEKFSNNVAHLTFTIMGQHRLSGSWGVVSKNFYRNSIVMGKFETGKSTKIIS